MKKTTRKAAPTVPTKNPPARKSAGRMPRAPSNSRNGIILNVRADIGFGNQLYVRGDGPGLSWERGLPAQNMSPDLWTIEFSEANQPITFKCLVNDEAWSVGEDFVAVPGSTITVEPAFA
jgi:hypothetical protein